MRALGLSLLLLLPAFGGLAASLRAPECGFVPGLGDACVVEGGYEMVLADGERLFTHGLDPLPDVELQTASFAGAASRSPPCIDDPLRDAHAHFIYAHPADKPDRSADLMPALRGLIREANGLLYREGAEFGAPVEYRFLCDADGEPTVSVATIPIPTGLGAYTQLVQALRAQGFVNGNAKYWVWYDDTTACACGGIASAPLDPERTPLNNANVGGHFGVTYGYMWALIPMHENGHNLGVVSNSAPDTSGAAHCNDGADIMCYPDGGPQSFYNGGVCTDRMHFDCGHDSYFHPDGASGTYVGHRWQIGAPIDRFVQGCLYEEQDILLPTGTMQVDVPAACQGHKYAIFGRAYGEPAHSFAAPLVRVSTNVFSLCWFDGALPLGCPTQKPWGHEGRVPPGATHALVTREQGNDARFTLHVV